MFLLPVDGMFSASLRESTTKRTIMKRSAIILLLGLMVATSCVKKDAKSGVANADSAPGDAAIVNRQITDQFNKIHLDEPVDKDALTAAEIAELYQTTVAHPVAKLSKVSFYDPAGRVGFCFGRSTTAHLVARKMALNPDSIKKLFIVGDLRAPGGATEWRFHVTTLVKRDDGVWIAVDPIMNKTMTANQWIKRVRYYWDRWYIDDPNYDKPQAKIYLAPFDAVLPDIRTFSANETGELLIDISFDPEGREGFTRRPDLQKPGVDELAYELSKEAAHKYFLSFNEDPESDSFDFVGLNVVDTIYISYESYFVDLLQSFENGTWKSQGAVEPSTLTLSGSTDIDPEVGPSSTYSFRFDKLLAE
jgi:hypothetical protein